MGSRRSVKVRRFDGKELRVGTCIFTASKTSDPTSLVPYAYPEGAENILNLTTGELALDSDFKIAYVSEGFLKTVGFDERDLIGKDLSILLPSDMPIGMHGQRMQRRFPESADYYVILISANVLPTPDPTPDPKQLHAAFISYKRKTSQDLATRVTSFLIEAGYPIWLDVQAIPDGSDFTQYIREGILSANKFIPFLTKEYLDDSSVHCHTEMRLAIEMGKPILPIVQDEDAIAIFNEKYPELENISWVFFRPGLDDPGASFKRIVAFIEEDGVFHRQSTIYLKDATEWKRNRRGLMLGPEARLASTWLDLNEFKHKNLSPLTVKYIQKSGSAYRWRQRLPIIALATMMSLMGGAAVLLWILYSQVDALLVESEKNRYQLQIGEARSSSLVALYLAESQPCASLSKAIQALKEGDAALAAYEEKFPEDTAENNQILFDLRRKLNYTRVNLSQIMDRQAFSGSSEAMIMEAEAQLGLKEQRGNCEIQ